MKLIVNPVHRREFEVVQSRVNAGIHVRYKVFYLRLDSSQFFQARISVGVDVSQEIAKLNQVNVDSQTFKKVVKAVAELSGKLSLKITMQLYLSGVESV